MIHGTEKEVFVFPASFAQQRLWLLNQLEPGSTAYNMPWVIRVGGALDVGALEQTLNAIVARHESLRTTFVSEDGSPMQVIAERGAVALPVTDLRQLPEAKREAEAMRLATEEAQQTFDLASGPLMRAGLLRLGEAEHILLLIIHHVIFDEWSADVLFQKSRRSMSHSRREGRRRFPVCRSSTPITLSGNASGYKAGCSMNSSPTGSDSLVARPPCWSCRPTVRVRPCRATGAHINR